MARILYISPEHVSGTLSLFQKGHRNRGNECRYATFYPSPSSFPEDVCLNLPFMPDAAWVKNLKKILYRSAPEMRAEADRPGYPPTWQTSTAAEAVFFFLRDFLISGRINRVIGEFEFDRFDLYHLDQGLDFFRNARFIRRMKNRGGRIVCFYHGTDLRNRGVIPAVDEISDLNLTSELDLLDKHPNIKYLHLPLDVKRFDMKEVENDPLIIGHACRAQSARHFKGTDHIIKVMNELERDFPVKFDLVEGLPNDECMRRKERWDIAVDQIADRGGWGYGMNSLETLAMGVPTCTRMNDKCDAFFTDHPFVNVDENSLKDKLVELIENRDHRRQLGKEGRKWVEENHSLDAVMDQLYRYYQDAGIKL
ncbi:hypothetical protein CEE37_04795 [candidate division LCP-89 bacterium B3_LCP]|uniref:Spore protein YkvP/CgeB glycosyl transferase-like domain-containing protein n=1 Tax=candidate division LCP-89 bacterium B3_LCP TaxID=2012998 RepID=A0A532V3U3_UNCL8|nr:MAG: hypothetical protein CEE37_04795 [candidate division LCP-89 bacterium B3_LCP]